ncbi:putative DNA-binding protein [Mycoplasmopsis agalactiae]|uniref:Sigma-70, region 4 n=1 Tax=Mycoplasmopsis agalactiae (strain NCTC 10123 / CIP 59.7 / PG2) TaxID=347257 RepID=A5IXZ2_MYCAP|nr:sigma factor-like helix-turn-helix DNA-binding protein [Mycoplasmopsis agalactiae]MCE6056988.1 hypothetical protein [Mycoplasmopsis agalactiae]MCE6078775.1 hypothetical protein [Mycoplasmopsis agalactiae]MCE6095158.1 hypothetical protein [Mycoplasmopsis agalactiae]MCE6114413.1 hypothetical protein [Mycoplasmopsis agalactiae]NLS34248.1 hypothetical protein [Mycoplasmopsis agalactiae]
MKNNPINDIKNIEHLCSLFEKYEGLLTQTQKQTFRLYFYENLSYAEIAKITATTRTAAYDSVHKAINNLKKIEAKTSE